MPSEDHIAALWRIARKFAETARAELDARWTAWKLDLADSEVHEVVGALLARQVTLARTIISNPGTWTPHAAPVLLRAMADVRISLDWILGSPNVRATRYIEYGLGQMKLEMEHRKAVVDKDNPDQEQQLLIEYEQAWIDEQRFHFLTTVDLGAWSGITTRAMAEEAGCLEFYNYVYTPFSAATHSMWHHVGRLNVKTCTNPLHRYHRVPCDDEMPLDFTFPHLAAKYLAESFASFDDAMKITVNVPSAYETYSDAIDNDFGDAESDHGQKLE
jgi:hypothetical protein